MEQVMREEKTLPMISVVIPCYNCEKYAARALDSLIAQTYPNMEIICVDDGSADQTGEILKKYSEMHKNITVIFQQNRGAAAARNNGIGHASGEYIGFIDSDDSAEPDMYQVLYDNLKEHQADISMVNAVYTYEDGRKEEPVFDLKEGYISNRAQLELLLAHKGSAALWNCLFPASLCRKNPLPEHCRNEDFLFWIHMIPMFTSIYYQNAAKYHYYVHEGSVSRSGFSQTMIDMVDNTWEAQKLVDEKYPELHELMDRFFLFQRLEYLRFIPLKEMKSSNLHYIGVIKDIHDREAGIDSNPYLKPHEKKALHLFLKCPHLTNCFYAFKRSAGRAVRSIMHH